MQSEHPEALQHAHVFSLSDQERSMLTRMPNSSEARKVRRRFVAAHATMSDTEIAKLMVEGKFYTTPHIPTVAHMVNRLRTSKR